MAVIGTTRLESAIGKFNGGFVHVRKCNKDGTEISPADSWHDIGVVGDITFNRSREGAEQVRDGRNLLVQDIPGAVTGSLEVTLLQRDKKSLDIITDTFGDYYRVHFSMGQDGPGSTDVNHLELLIPVAKFSGDQNAAFGASRTTMTVTLSMLDTVGDATTLGPLPNATNGVTFADTGSTPSYSPTKTWGHADFTANQLYVIFDTNITAS